MILRLQRFFVCRQLFLLIRIFRVLMLLLRDMPFLEQVKVSYWNIFLHILFIVWKYMYRVRNFKDVYHVSCSSSPEKSQHRHIHRNAWSWSLPCSLSTRLGKPVWVVSIIILLRLNSWPGRLMKTSSKQRKHDLLQLRAGLFKARLYWLGISENFDFSCNFSARFSETYIVYPASVLSLNNLTVYKT